MIFAALELTEPQREMLVTLTDGDWHRVAPRTLTAYALESRGLVECTKCGPTHARLTTKGMEALASLTAKPCSRCGRLRPLDEFPILRRSPDGRHSQCKECKAAAVRKGDGAKYGTTEWRQAVTHGSRARWAATRRLIEAHRDEYQRYLEDEREAESNA